MSKCLQEIVTRFQGLKAIISDKIRDEFWFLKLKDLDYNSLTMQIMLKIARNLFITYHLVNKLLM